jgi:hypothetical protein
MHSVIAQAAATNWPPVHHWPKIRNTKKPQQRKNNNAY